MYDTILISTDGSENARLASERAIDTAVRHEATVHVLYVIERTRDDPTQKGLEETVAEGTVDGNDVVETVASRASDEGLETVTAVEQGVARTMIESYASDHDIDLIVIGSTGASDTSEKLLGTVSKYVVNEAPADVLVVRPDERLE